MGHLLLVIGVLNRRNIDLNELIVCCRTSEKNDKHRFSVECQLCPNSKHAFISIPTNDDDGPVRTVGEEDQWFPLFLHELDKIRELYESPFIMLWVGIPCMSSVETFLFPVFQVSWFGSFPSGAKGMMNHFDDKELLFGEEKIVKDIEFNELSETAKGISSSGFVQWTGVSVENVNRRNY